MYWSIAIIIISSILLYLYLNRQSPKIHPQTYPLPSPPSTLLPAISKAITYPTITSSDSSTFLSFYKYLEETFPSLYSNFKVSQLPCALLFYLQSHHDVVAAPSTWDHPPFSGYYDSTHLYGRGSLDNKTNLISLLQAVNDLFSSNFVPKRTILIMSSADEETINTGVKSVITHLIEESLPEPYAVLDEGYCVMETSNSFLKKDLAIVGIAEKARTSAVVRVNLHGGHASLPPLHTETDDITKFIQEIESAGCNAFWSASTVKMLEEFGKQMGFPFSLVAKVLPFFGKYSARILAVIAKKYGALFKTSCVMTYLNLGDKKTDNALPNVAEFCVDIRRLPEDSLEDVKKRIDAVITKYKNTFKNIEIKWFSEDICDRTSEIECEAYHNIVQTINDVFDNSITTPSLVLASTDSYYYMKVSSRVFRFAPNLLSFEEVSSMHGVNEKIKITSIDKTYQFYSLFIKKCCE
ncbi:carboxypeptidase S [Entamoeba marina]